MASNCNQAPDDSFCVCSRPEYIQYNANGKSSGSGLGNRCCDVIQSTPDILHRLPDTVVSSEIGSVSQFLDYFDQLEITPCDYSVYFGGETPGTSNADFYLNQNFPELFNYANRQRYIFNTFYFYKKDFYPPSVTSRIDLVPVIEKNTVKTPEGTMPLIFNYYDDANSISQYLFIVWPIGKDIPDLPFEYRLFYFYDNLGQSCKSNYCTTSHEPYRGITFSDTGPGNNSSLLNNDGYTISVVFICLISLFIVIFIGLIIWNFFKYKNSPEKVVVLER